MQSQKLPLWNLQEPNTEENDILLDTLKTCGLCTSCDIISRQEFFLCVSPALLLLLEDFFFLVETVRGFDKPFSCSFTSSTLYFRCRIPLSGNGKYIEAKRYL